MTLRVGHPSKKGVTDTSDARLDFRNKYVCNADGSPRGGVTSPVGVPLLSATSTMNVQVAAFSLVTVRDGGVVEMANDGPVNVLLEQPPSSQSRIDVIFAKQNDSSSTVSVPDTNDQAVFGVLKGEASATPVKRTDLPAGAEEIGTVLIPSTATATNSSAVVITTTCRFTAAAGGKVPFRTLADLQGWTTAGPGQEAYVFGDATSGNNGGYLWSGSVWLASSGGRVLLRPTVAVPSGGTATVQGSGAVAFDQAVALVLTAFSGFRRYEIKVSTYGVNDGYPNTQNVGMTAQLCSAGTADTATKYYANSNSGIGFWPIGGNGQNGRDITISLSDVSVASTTKGSAWGGAWDSGSGQNVGFTTGLGHLATTAYDGIRLNLGKASGVVSVYGLTD
jgi:hypothetical protein